MRNLIIRRMPAEIHQKIKERAVRHRRSINKEILMMLEKALAEDDLLPVEPPVPFKGRFQIDDEWLRKAKDEGRP